jgi:TRAP-type C4-dicarboxylate transport system permease small subunit
MTVSTEIRAKMLSDRLATKLRVRAAMDALYRFCVIVAGGALVLISAVIPWGVFTRYVLNSASSWPEPMAILLTIVLTFFGAAACYRAGTHMSVSVLVRVLSPPLRRVIEPFSEGLVALVGFFMVFWGARLVATTWHQSIAEFPALSVGVTYLPIPMGGAVTLLFVAERLLIGCPPQAGEPAPH